MSKKEYRILNLGAGVQSTTVYLMYDFDYAIFADTGEEPQAVYAHLEWLKGLKRSPILVCGKGKLGDDLMRGENSTKQRFASIPAYTAGNGTEEGILRRQCSKEYKVEVIERTIRREILGLAPRQRIPRNVYIHQFYGISLDEAGRAFRIRKNLEQVKWITPHFPLIEMDWTRADCLNYLANKVPHQVPRSACVFCPYHDDAEWLRVKENPVDWARAVQIDEALRVPGNIVNRNLNQKLYVHRSCQPLAQIEFKPQSPRAQQLNIKWNQECLGVCGN